MKANEGVAEATLSVYRALLMASANPSLGADRHPRTLTALEIETFRDKRLKEVSPTTVVRELDRIRAFRTLNVTHDGSRGMVAVLELESGASPDLAREVLGRFALFFEIR